MNKVNPQVVEILQALHCLQTPDIDIKFNYQFLIDALKTISEDKITIQYKDSDNPARIDSGDFLYVIMPINM